MTALITDLYPAIDLRGGRVVRLSRGDYDAETVYGDDPVAVAESFAAAGAPWVHVVDLEPGETILGLLKPAAQPFDRVERLVGRDDR